MLCMDVPEEPIILTPTSFQRAHQVTDAERELASLVFVLDLQAAQPSVQRLRDWALAELAPRPGEVAVDVGCGTGEEVRRLAALVGSGGRAVGVEPHPGLRGEAAARAEGTTATFVDGDAYELPFEDGTVDLVRCERVWQHLARPQQAADEIARVLAPGGRVAVLDSDWETVISRGGDPELRRRSAEASRRRMVSPTVGRDLRSLLQHAGLTVRPDIGSAALVQPDEVMAHPEFYAQGIALDVAEGVMTQAEAEKVRDDAVDAARRGEAFWAVTMFGVVADRGAMLV